MRKLLSKIITQLLLPDLEYFRSKLIITKLVYGPKDRLHLGKMVDLQDTIFNTKTGHIYIGDHTFFGQGCMVLTGYHNPLSRNRDRQQNHPTEGRDIFIGKGVWVASGAIVCGNVKIGDDVVIAAGAVVTKDCIEAGIYAGIPAIKIKNLYFE